MAWENSPAKAIVLEKVSAGPGLAVGSIVQWSYKALPPLTALARARAALKRDHPDENPLHWKKVG